MGAPGNYIYPISLILFILVSVLKEIYGFELVRGVNIVIALSAIYCVFYYFRHTSTNNVIMRFLNVLGKHSLEIYICHFFFLFKIPVMGKIIHNISLSNDHDFSILNPSIICSIVFTLINIFLCYLFIKIVQKSSFLYQILFGRKSA